MRRLGEQVSILTRSQQEAKRWCTRSVPNVPKAKLTYLWPVHRIGLVATLVAPVAPTKRLASAIHCSHCTLRWLQSMTLKEMVLGLNKSCRGPIKWPSGRMQVGTAGNKVLFSALSQARQAPKERLSGRGLSSRHDLTCFESSLITVQLQHIHVSFRMSVLSLYSFRPCICFKEFGHSSLNIHM